MTKTSKTTEPEKVEETETGLRGKQELFCMYFTQDRECFDNATLAYAVAYGFELDTLSREKQMVSIPGKKRKVKEKDSEYKRAYNTCSVAGRALLRNHKIRLRCRELLNELLQDTIVDAQLARVITQDKKLDSKVQGIKEYNRLRKRIDPEEVPPQIIINVGPMLERAYGRS